MDLSNKIIGGITIVALGGFSVFGGCSLISINLNNSKTVEETEHVNPQPTSVTTIKPEEPSEQPNNENQPTVQPLPVTNNVIKGSISNTHQKQEYSYTTTNAGKYRFDLNINDVNSNYKVTIFDSKNEKIGQCYSYNDGFTVTLEATSNYVICVEQSKKFCEYEILIGTPMSTQSINGSSFGGAITYIDQQNYYAFTSTTKGRYRFDFNINDVNTNYKFNIYDDKNDRIGYGYSYNNGVTVELNENSNYTIKVEQNKGFPEYNINIGIPKPINDMMYSSVSGNITYIDQEDFFTYAPQSSGTYIVNLDIDDVNTNYKITIYDNKNSKVESGYSYNKTMKVSLEAGQIYKICISQNKGTCAYNVDISYSE